MNDYRLFLERGSSTSSCLTSPWVGLTTGRRIASICQAYHLTAAPHSPHSPLCTIITSHFSASTPNRALEVRERRGDRTFDVVYSIDFPERRPQMEALAEKAEDAGVTWMCESVFGMRYSSEEALRRVREGPPG